MDTVYSLFWESAFSSKITAYYGHLDKRPKDGTGVRPEYRAKIKTTSFQLWQLSQSETETCMVGKYNGFLGHSMTIRGNHLVSTLKIIKYMPPECIFVFNSEEFKWYGNLANNSWSLKNGRGQDVAFFDRVMHKTYKLGKLYIRPGINDMPDALVVLTCVIFYHYVFSCESSGG